jgi:hypothetical protein
MSLWFLLYSSIYPLLLLHLSHSFFSLYYIYSPYYVCIVTLVFYFGFSFFSFFKTRLNPPFGIFTPSYFFLSLQIVLFILFFLTNSVKIVFMYLLFFLSSSRFSCPKFSSSSTFFFQDLLFLFVLTYSTWIFSIHFLTIYSFYFVSLVVFIRALFEKKLVQCLFFIHFLTHKKKKTI